MLKQNRTLLIIIFLFAQFYEMQSQIAVSQASGCVGDFNPVFSGPAGATNVFWNLGPGQGTSTNAVVGTGYPNPGTFVITYSAILNGSPVNYSTSVIVHPKPSGSFSYQIPATHCAPMSVSFNATSNPPNCIFSWAFGDLSALGSGSSVTHAYTFKGSFKPILIVTDAVTGCTVNATNNSAPFINVSDKPSLNITSSAGWGGCTPPFLTTIDGSSSTTGSPLGGGLTFVWGGPGVGGSTAPTPGQVSFPQGIHTITLTATDNNQCSNTTTSVITVVNPSLTASMPGTVCLGQPVPGSVNTSQSYVQITGTPFSGALIKNTIPNNVTNIDTMFIATVKGPHQVTFLVQSQGCPPLSVVKNVFVEEVLANFIPLPPGASCDPTMSVTYSNTSTNNSSAPLTFTWMGTNAQVAYNQITPATIFLSNMGNATFTLSQGTKNPYTIYNYFNPYITLIAKSTSIAQCSASVLYTVLDTLIRPTAFFVTDKKEGCLPLTVRFRDSSFSSSKFPIPALNYTWCNGATPSVVVTGTNQTQFTYTNVGTFHPYLIVETINGCRDTSFFDTITVVTPPLINATYPTTVCADYPVTITMTGTAITVPSSSVINHWHAETDEGFFSGCISNAAPTWSFTHPGTHAVVVTAYQAGCKNTVTLTTPIQVFGPVGRFVFETYCGPNRATVTFTVFLEDATGATLDFGDGNQHLITSTTPTMGVVVNHTYAQVKTYTVTLTPTTSGPCVPKPYKREVKLKNPQVSILHDGKPMPVWPEALACTKSPFKFTATFTDVATACSRGLSWNFATPAYTLAPVNCDDGNFNFHIHGICPSCVPVIADPIMLDTFRLAGDYHISVTGRDANGCEVTESHKFRISSAIPNFTWAANPACFSDNPIQIINNTPFTQVAPDVISSYTWSFGDGLTQTSTNPNDNPIHNYAVVAIPSQTYNVMCIAQNTLGCTDTTIQKFQINNPYAGYSADDAFPCIPLGKGKAVNFSAGQGYTTYSVNYGDSPGWVTLPSFNNVSHVYNLPGTYFTTLTVVDAAQCKSTNVLTITALGQPTASFIFETGNKLCVVAKPQMKSNSIANITPIDGYSWSMKNITTPAGPKDSLDEILDVAGTYTVSLTVSIGNSQLCPSTATNVIYVYDTKGKMELDKTTFCLGETITARVKDLQDVFKWQWFFGDLVPQQEIYNNQFATNPVLYPYVNYPTALGEGKTTVRVQLSSPGDGCVVSLTTAIQVIRIVGSFIKPDSNFAHCQGLTDVFKKTTPNPLNLTLYHLWDFGDGNRAVGDSAKNVYQLPGTYQVKLQVRDTIYHCADTAFKTMIIFPNPTASLFIKDTLICPGDTFEISGSGSAGVISGTLTSASGQRTIDLTSSSTFTTGVFVNRSDTFTLKVTDINGCEAAPNQKSIFVPEAAPQVNTGTTVVIGQPIQINMDAGSGFSYTWTPEVLALNNSKIPNPVSTTTSDITYTVQIVDEPLHCYLTVNTFSIHVLPLTTVDVPSAFTPNGDGVNDVVYPGGWGIRSLNYFRIYNRWGQLIFESNDLAYGWDGTFEGKPQNTETYVWQVEVQTWVDSEPIISKTGTIKLLR